MKLVMLAKKESTIPKLKDTFKLLSAVADSNGVEIYFASLREWEDASFLNALRYDRDGKENFVEIIPDVIYSRALTNAGTLALREKLERKFLTINPLLFENICDNKYLNYIIFSEYYPKTFLINNCNTRKFSAYVDKIATPKVVLKPNIGSQGKGVVIQEKTELPKTLSIEQDQIIQSFIESSNGIKNIADSVHEIRVTVVDREIAYIYAKIAGDGQLLCNVSQGGKMKIVDEKDTPEEILSITKNIISKLDSFEGLVYSVDFSKDKDGQMKIIEMNARPGFLFNPEDKNLQIKYFEKIVDNFKLQWQNNQ